MLPYLVAHENGQLFMESHPVDLNRDLRLSDQTAELLQTPAICRPCARNVYMALGVAKKRQASCFS
jgi:hypothetical protein